MKISELLKEDSGRTVVLAFGRMNPLTTGHEKLVGRVTEIAAQAGGTPMIYLSHTQDRKKNPLSYDEKVDLATQAFGDVIVRSQARTIVQILQELESSFDHLVYVAGEDRVASFEELLTTYNGQEYNFDSIRVVSAGERDPDADDVTGMSASKMRVLAIDGNLDTFAAGLPKRLQRDPALVMNLVRGGMGLAPMDKEAVTESRSHSHSLSKPPRIGSRLILAAIPGDNTSWSAASDLLHRHGFEQVRRRDTSTWRARYNTTEQGWWRLRARLVQDAGVNVIDLENNITEDASPSDMRRRVMRVFYEGPDLSRKDVQQIDSQSFSFQDHTGQHKTLSFRVAPAGQYFVVTDRYRHVVLDSRKSEEPLDELWSMVWRERR